MRSTSTAIVLPADTARFLRVCVLLVYCTTSECSLPGPSARGLLLVHSHGPLTMTAVTLPALLFVLASLQTLVGALGKRFCFCFCLLRHANREWCR